MTNGACSGGYPQSADKSPCRECGAGPDDYCRRGVDWIRVVDLSEEVDRLRTALDSVRFFVTSDGESKAEAFARLRQILDAMEEGK